MIRRRILSAISGNILVQLINAVIQLAGVPILLSYWGVGYYGEWLLLFTIPAYIGMSDLGLGTSTTSELSMLVEAGRDIEAKDILRNAFWFVLMVGGIPFVLLFGTLFIFPWYQWLNLSEIEQTDFLPTLSLLILYVYLALFLTLPLGYYRVQKVYHRERYLSSGFRLVEFLFVIGAVMMGYGIVMVAFIYFSIRLLQFMFVVYDLSTRYEGFRILPIGFRYCKVRKLLKPGLSTMSIYLGQNLMIQGLVSIIGIGLGSMQVVLFSTTRTLLNMVKQIIGIVNLSVTSEFSYAYGAGNVPLLQKLFDMTRRGNFLLALTMLVGLFFVGPWIYEVWTGGKVEVIEPFYSIMLAGTLLGALWNVHLVLLVATNNLGRTGILFLACAAILVITNILGVAHYGIVGVSISLLLFELAMLFIMQKTSREVLFSKSFAKSAPS